MWSNIKKDDKPVMKPLNSFTCNQTKRETEGPGDDTANHGSDFKITIPVSTWLR